ncbi:hypothetical protein LXL04_034222 [Taraxacum kok-saghyz]
MRPRVWSCRIFMFAFIIALFQSCSINRGAWVEFQGSQLQSKYSSNLSSIVRTLNVPVTQRGSARASLVPMANTRPFAVPAAFWAVSFEVPYVSTTIASLTGIGMASLRRTSTKSGRVALLVATGAEQFSAYSDVVEAAPVAFWKSSTILSWWDCIVWCHGRGNGYRFLLLMGSWWCLGFPLVVFLPGGLCPLHHGSLTNTFVCELDSKSLGALESGWLGRSYPALDLRGQSPNVSFHFLVLRFVNALNCLDGTAFSTKSHSVSSINLLLQTYYLCFYVRYPGSGINQIGPGSSNGCVIYVLILLKDSNSYSSGSSSGSSSSDRNWSAGWLYESFGCSHPGGGKDWAAECLVSVSSCLKSSARKVFSSADIETYASIIIITLRNIKESSIVVKTMMILRERDRMWGPVWTLRQLSQPDRIQTQWSWQGYNRPFEVEKSMESMSWDWDPHSHVGIQLEPDELFQLEPD